MYQLICKTAYVGADGPGGLLAGIRIREWRSRWNNENAERSGKTMLLGQIDDTIITYLIFDNEEEAVIFKLTHL